MKKNIAILGTNGQLGLEFKQESNLFLSDFNFFFFTKNELNILNHKSVEKIFLDKKITHCINCSAYTKVDNAEEEMTPNFDVNSKAIKNLINICKGLDIYFFHFSTDYVFDGTSGKPYTEKNKPNPINQYGKAKLEGEQHCLNYARALVFRTSWVYSKFGNNFVKTMLKLLSTKEEISVVSDQIGSPTYAKDIALVVLEILKNNLEKNNAGLYHFTNEGSVSWYEFANEIKQMAQLNCHIKPINTSEYKTLAQRPLYSVLSKDNFVQTFKIPLKNWTQSLKEMLNAP